MRRVSDYDLAADELYGASFDDFIGERKRLAAALKKGGDAAGAKTLAALAKPSRSAWAINQLHRRARTELDALLRAGVEVRDATLAGRSEALAGATQVQRAKLGELRRRAAEILAESGHSPTDALLKAVTTNLQSLSAAGSFDPDPAGRLAKDRDPPGFDLFAAAAGLTAGTLAPKPAPTAPPPPPEKDDAKAKEEQKAAREEQALRAKREAEEKRTQAEAALEKAETVLAAAEGQLQSLEEAGADAARVRAEAQRERDRIRGELAKAESELIDAQVVESSAQSEIQKARKAIEAASGAADRTRAELRAAKAALAALK
jgi:hypothetical protein